MFQVTPRLHFMKLFYDNRPRAYAEITGGEKHPNIRGYLYFYTVSKGGILVEAEMFGLPDDEIVKGLSFFGFHIHEKGGCSLDFSKTGAPYNPWNMAHPNHGWDLPPLMSAGGYAWAAFYDPGLELYEIEGKPIVVCRHPDDFTAQPAGGSGEKIGCGVIMLL